MMIKIENKNKQIEHSLFRIWSHMYKEVDCFVGKIKIQEINIYILTPIVRSGSYQLRSHNYNN